MADTPVPTSDVAPVPVPASLASLFQRLGYELHLTARRLDGRELTARDVEGLRRASRAYEIQHPRPDVTAAEVDILAEARKDATAASATGTGGE